MIRSQSEIIAIWQRVVNRCADTDECELLHMHLLEGIHRQIMSGNHPTAKYRELRELENILLARVKDLGGYPRDPRMPKG